MKKAYLEPSIKVCVLDDTDLICTSEGIQMASEAADESQQYSRSRNHIWDD